MKLNDNVWKERNKTIRNYIQFETKRFLVTEAMRFQKIPTAELLDFKM